MEKKVPLTKEQFVHYINFIKERSRSVDRIGKFLEDEFGDFTFYPYNKYEAELVTLLETIFETDVISYFIYELNFGEENFSGECITDRDGTTVSLTTPEELYDYVVKEYLSA